MIKLLLSANDYAMMMIITMTMTMTNMKDDDDVSQVLGPSCGSSLASWSLDLPQVRVHQKTNFSILSTNIDLSHVNVNQ